jgi:hypothetical protein
MLISRPALRSGYAAGIVSPRRQGDQLHGAAGYGKARLKNKADLLLPRTVASKSSTSRRRLRPDVEAGADHGWACRGRNHPLPCHRFDARTRGTRPGALARTLGSVRRPAMGI